MKKKNNKGFSLIELIIAIAILVILTGLLAPQFMRYMEKSREAKDIQTLDTIFGAAQAALAEEEAYQDAKTDTLLSTKGVELSVLLEGADPNAFAKEFRLTAGKINADTVWVSKAITDATDATDATSDVYVQVDKDLKVTVWVGGEAAQVGTTDEWKPANVIKTTGDAEFLISK